MDSDISCVGGLRALHSESPIEVSCQVAFSNTAMQNTVIHPPRNNETSIGFSHNPQVPRVVDILYQRFCSQGF